MIEVKKYFKLQPSMVEISVPEGSKFTVCGDIHGQFYDLLNIFKLNGEPSANNPYVSFTLHYILVAVCWAHKGITSLVGP